MRDSDSEVINLVYPSTSHRCVIMGEVVEREGREREEKGVEGREMAGVEPLYY